VRVAAVQLSSTGEKASNLAAADRHVRAAAADGARLIVLPEKWTAIGGPQTLLAAAESLHGEAISWARAIAAELQVDLVAGSIAERQEGEELLSNTCVHVDREGEIRAIYRKIHMFDVAVDGRIYNESALERPGEEVVLSETSSRLPLGLAICYDLRFPELFRILALRGALAIALPSAFTLKTTTDHWEVLVRARAIENQTFVIAANQVGEHADGSRSGGRSMIVDPWGSVLARRDEGEGHVLADLDLEAQAEVRRKLPSLANRRPQAYAWPETDASRSGADASRSGAEASPR
jgi:deaminated glutathione amidase